jgi:predicted Zn-dependent protease with MMP-like domain
MHPGGTAPYCANFGAAVDTLALGTMDGMVEVAPERFEEMVSEALDGLPPKLGRLMRNVAVTVQHEAGPMNLLGLYEGVPLTERTSNYAGVLPDRITIYHQMICAICSTEAEVVTEVRRVVIHEVGHHFGIDDERLHELGW